VRQSCRKVTFPWLRPTGVLSRKEGGTCWVLFQGRKNEVEEKDDGKWG